jgi:hypothetical protein
MNNKRLFRAVFSLLVLGAALAAASCKAYFGTLDLDDIASGLTTRPPEIIIVPFKTLYASNESIAADDLAVYTRDTATGKMAPVSAFTINPTVLTGLTGKQTITVAVTDYPAPGKTTTGQYTIWVNEPPPITPPGLVVVPLRTSYFTGQTVNKTYDVIVYKSGAGGAMTQLLPADYDLTIIANGGSIVTGTFPARGTYVVKVVDTGSPAIFVTYQITVLNAAITELAFYYADNTSGDPDGSLILNDQGKFVYSESNPWSQGDRQYKVIHSVVPIDPLTGQLIAGKRYLLGRQDDEAVTLNFTGMGNLDFKPAELGFILVSSVAELQLIGSSTEGGHGKYVLDGNLDLLGEATGTGFCAPQQWEPIHSNSGQADHFGSTGSFDGVFDGADYTIRGMAIGGDPRQSGAPSPVVQGDAGLFAKVDGALIKNLTVEGWVNVNGNYTGGIVGRAAGGNCVIRNCVSRVAVNGNSYTGGIAGMAALGTKIENCRNEGAVTGSGRNTGGIAGDAPGSLSPPYTPLGVKIENCRNEGDVTGYEITGGIAGSARDMTSIKNCWNGGDITGHRFIGGVTGQLSSQGSIIACSNAGELSATGDRTGGIVGGIEDNSSAEVTACRNEGKVAGDWETGGVAGYVGKTNTITACYNIAQVSGTADYAGGVAGRFETGTSASIKASYNTGRVSGGGNVGGVAGDGDSPSIEACYWDSSVPSPPSKGIGGSIDSDTGAEPFSSIVRDFPDIENLALIYSGWRTGSGINGRYWRSGTGRNGLPPRLYWEQ